MCIISSLPLFLEQEDSQTPAWRFPRLVCKTGRHLLHRLSIQASTMQLHLDCWVVGRGLIGCRVPSDFFNKSQMIGKKMIPPKVLMGYCKALSG